MQIEVRGVSIESELHLSTNPHSATLVLSHPHPLYGGTLTNKVIDQLFRRAKDRDISAFRYNTRGTGKSTGTFSNGIEEEQDLEALIFWLEEQRIDLSRMILVGYSFGSWITARVALGRTNPCVLIAPAVSMYEFPELKAGQQKFIFSAEKDELVSLEKIESYVASLPEPKTHIRIPNADHYFIGTTSILIKSIFENIEQLLVPG